MTFDDDIKTEIKHNTNNLILRFFANQICSPVSSYFLNKSLNLYFKYEAEYERTDDFKPSFPDSLRISVYGRLYGIFNKPYMRWGSFYMWVQ